MRMLEELKKEENRSHSGSNHLEQTERRNEDKAPEATPKPEAALVDNQEAAVAAKAFAIKPGIVVLGMQATQALEKVRQLSFSR